MAFGVALIALAVLLFAAISDNGNQRGCLCRNLGQILTGIIGTLIFSIVAIVITGPFISALFVGILAFFFALMIGTFICYILCLANCRYQECD